MTVDVDAPSPDGQCRQYPTGWALELAEAEAHETANAEAEIECVASLMFPFSQQQVYATNSSSDHDYTVTSPVSPTTPVTPPVALGGDIDSEIQRLAYLVAARRTLAGHLEAALALFPQTPRDVREHLYNTNATLIFVALRASGVLATLFDAAPVLAYLFEDLEEAVVFWCERFARRKDVVISQRAADKLAAQFRDVRTKARAVAQLPCFTRQYRPK